MQAHGLREQVVGIAPQAMAQERQDLPPAVRLKHGPSRQAQIDQGTQGYRLRAAQLGRTA